MRSGPACDPHLPQSPSQEIAGALNDPVTAGTLQLVPVAERHGTSPALGMLVRPRSRLSCTLQGNICSALTAFSSADDCGEQSAGWDAVLRSDDIAVDDAHPPCSQRWPAASSLDPRIPNNGTEAHTGSTGVACGACDILNIECCAQASAALLRCLQRCVAAEVFLRPLADKFARLALQLLARYTAWLAAGVVAPPQPPAPTIASPPDAQQPQVFCCACHECAPILSILQKCRLSGGSPAGFPPPWGVVVAGGDAPTDAATVAARLSSLGVPSAPCSDIALRDYNIMCYAARCLTWAALQGPEGWARRAPVEQLATARSDVDALLAWLQRTYGPQLLAALAFLPPEVLRLSPRFISQCATVISHPLATHAHMQDISFGCGVAPRAEFFATAPDFSNPAERSGNARPTPAAAETLFVPLMFAAHCLQAAQSVQSALDVGVSAVEEQGRALSATAIEGIGNKCIAVLKQMRAISTTHRMVNRCATALSISY